MRRLFLSFASLGLLGAVLGCNHTHGVCDCDHGGPCGTAGSHSNVGHQAALDVQKVSAAEHNAPPGGAAAPAQPLPPGAPAPAPAPEPAPEKPKL